MHRLLLKSNGIGRTDPTEPRSQPVPQPRPWLCLDNLDSLQPFLLRIDGHSEDRVAPGGTPPTVLPVVLASNCCAQLGQTACQAFQYASKSGS